MQLLQQVTDPKVMNRLFSYMQKIGSDLKTPAKDNDDSWEVTFLDGIVFTVPNRNILPSLVFIEPDLSSSYLKPIKDLLPSLNFSIDLKELIPLLDFVKKTQVPQFVKLYDEALQIQLPNGTERTFPTNKLSIDRFNSLVEELETAYTVTTINNLPVPYDYMHESFSERSVLNVVNLNVNLQDGTMTHTGFDLNRVNTRLLRKNIIGVSKSSKKLTNLDGSITTEYSYTPLLVDFLDAVDLPDRGCVRLTSLGKYYKVEGYYYVFKGVQTENG